MSDFATFVFEQLSPPPQRVLEVGCGREGGLVGVLAEAGYDVLGVDPEAPEGERFVRAGFQTLDGEWDAIVASRVLHHVEPLESSLDLLAGFAPLLVVDEFAPNLVGGAAQEWYEAQYGLLRAAGAEPTGPPSIDEWRARVDAHGWHADEVLLPALRARWRERVFERVPYLYRWLEGPSSEALEESLIRAGAFPAIGYRWAGNTRV